MSRILRRPMFRGGPVSSYGTGIASGLANGGRVGYATDQAGGIVLGKDLQNFRSLPSYNPKEYKFYTGGDDKRYVTDYIPKSAEDLRIFQDRSKWEVPSIEDIDQKIKDEVETIDFNRIALDSSGQISGDTLDTQFIETEAGQQKRKEELLAERAKKIDQMREYGIVVPGEGHPSEGIDATWSSKEDLAGDKKSKTMIMKEKEWSGEIDSTPSDAALEIAGISETGAEEPVTKDTDLGIKEMADEYFELMGGKKAKIQDASDYALQFFKSTVGEGKAMREAAGDVADLALSKPSRTEAIQNWATKTAIVRKGQMDDLEARIKSSESVADKNILAAQWKQLNAQGQWEKKINTILADKFGGDESKIKAATMDALGQPASLGAALMAYEKAFGLGMKPNQMAFEGMVSEYYDPAPENWEDNANVSGTYYVPGSMVVVVIEKGKLKNQKRR